MSIGDANTVTTRAMPVGKRADADIGDIPVRLGLSARLLLLTVLFVMLAQVLIFLPTVAGFRREYLDQKLMAAQLVLTALQASDGSIDPQLRDRLLDQAGMYGMTTSRPNAPELTLGPQMPGRIHLLYDLRNAAQWQLIVDAVDTMLRREDLVIGVTGGGREDAWSVVEVVLEERPLREAMLAYGRQVFALSLLLSITTAALVYASLQWLAVRPLLRLTESMVHFRKEPEDPDRIINPDTRHDEVGLAERALADMQRQLRTSLVQRARLAGVGTAVTKITHDLKNILATASLESDKLEASPDPEVRRLSAGIVKAVDRAVHLASSTLRFATLGLPQPRRRILDLRQCLEDLRASLAPSLAPCGIVVGNFPPVSTRVDPDLLHRALENMIRNACEAGATEVSLSHAVEDGHNELLVGDNGSGMPKRARDNLFVAFAGSAKPGGSGLGLPIARELMQVQGGDIALRSTSEKGTVFALRLPP